MSIPPGFGELIAKGFSLEQIASILRPPGEAAVLQRPALLRALDPGVYEVVTSDIEDVPPLRELAASGLIEALPRRSDTYRLTESQRRLLGHDEQRTTSAVRELSARLVGLFDAREDHVEALYHRIAVDPDDAVAHFERLFDEADKRFDLNGCHDLVGALNDRAALLSSRHRAIIEDRERYLASRGKWVVDWYRSARFVSPDSNLDIFKDLLDGGQGRSLLLWARGGMGKTMHVRWLIARQCVPRPDSVPCARVDFDFVEPRTAAREPWLLLLEMAAQLDPQLALEPFDPLLSQYGHHRRRLEPRVRGEGDIDSGWRRDRIARGRRHR